MMMMMMLLLLRMCLYALEKGGWQECLLRLFPSVYPGQQLESGIVHSPGSGLSFLVSFPPFWL